MLLPMRYYSHYLYPHRIWESSLIIHRCTYNKCCLSDVNACTGTSAVTVPVRWCHCHFRATAHYSYSNRKLIIKTFIVFFIRNVMPSQDRVCVSLTKPIELSGDILIKVYERQSNSRGTICRAQVNTSTIHGDRLTLRKPELDVAITGNPHAVSTITICTNSGDKKLIL